MSRRYAVLWSWLGIALMGFAAVGLADEVDAATGLVIDRGWELVRANCIACHSLRLVTAQRATRQTWLDLIRWMQRTQNLWQLAAEDEASMLDYLAKHYHPEPSRRRAALPPDLMPVPLSRVTGPNGAAPLREREPRSSPAGQD